MILSTLSQSERYTKLNPLFPYAFEYMRDTDLFALAPGRHQVLADDVFAIVEQVPARTKEMAKLEAHRKYIDIQLVLAGEESMGWKPLADCRDPAGQHDEEKDIRFFHDTPALWVPVPPGRFCIFFPEDAHAPLVGSGTIRKVIFKVAVQPA